MVRMPPDMVDRTPYKHIIYEAPEDEGIQVITLNDPDRMNPLSYELFMDLRHALVRAERDPKVKVVVIRGAGKAFSTGYDLTAYHDFQEGLSNLIAYQDHIKYYHQDVWFTIWNLQKPVIAQVHGYALAGGSELMTWCDITVIADDAVTGYPPARAMSVPDTVYWPWFCGIKKAKYLCLSGSPITGKEAAEIGLATMSVPAAELESTVRLIAKRLAMIPTELLYLNKFAINKSAEIMGIRVSQEIVGQLHDYSHTFRSTQEFGLIVKEQGLRAALEWRDGKFGDDYRALRRTTQESGTSDRFPQGLSLASVRGKEGKKPV